MLGLQSARNLGRLRIRIFDVLAFIQDHCLPANRYQALAQQAQLAVIDHVKIGLAKLFAKPFQFARRPNLDAQRRRKPKRLRAPIIHDALGTDH